MGKSNEQAENKPCTIHGVMVSSSLKSGYQPDKLGNCKCKNCTEQIEYHRYNLGIKKYGWDSEFRKEYQSMMLQLRHDELNEFFDKWDVSKN